jgi:hypothetical protein
MVQSARSPAADVPDLTGMGAMRRLALTVACLGVLAGCGGKSPRNYPVPEASRVAVDLDRTWDAVRRVLTDRGYEIQSEDQAAGVIETAWVANNLAYSSNILITQNEDRYSDCGKPGLGKVDHGKYARLTLSVVPSGPGQTDVVVRAAFHTTRSNLFGATGTVECRSRGRLEEEVLVETKVRALTEKYQQFRRGGR